MQLFYREKGNSSYPPLILLHGLWGASDNWLGVANQLATHFHVLLPDFRNHGHSPHDDVHDYSALSEDITDFIGSLNLPTPYRRTFYGRESIDALATEKTGNRTKSSNYRYMSPEL